MRRSDSSPASSASRIERPERKAEGNQRFEVTKIKDKKTTKYKYDIKREKSGEPDSKRLLEKVNEILKSCDKINEDKIEPTKSEKTKEKRSLEKKVDVYTNKEKRTISIIEKSPVTLSPPRRSPSPAVTRPRAWSRGRQRSHSGPRSLSPRGRMSPRYSPMRSRRPCSRSRSRSRSPPRRWRPLWLAVSPLSLSQEVTLEKASKSLVTLKLREQFSFTSNCGSQVKISKWSGRDCVNSVSVASQIVVLKEAHEVEVEIENPYYDRTLRLRKHEKIACMSVLSTPVPRQVSSLAPDRYKTDSERWFRVTNAVLHRKGRTHHTAGDDKLQRYI